MFVAQSAAATAVGGPVTYDATGAGTTTTGTTTSMTAQTWSHTCTGSNRAVIVAIQMVSTTSTGPAFDLSNVSPTVTYGGNAMTSAGGGVVWQNYGFVRIYYLLSPPTGAQTVSVSATWTGATSKTWGFIGGSVSYTGAAAVSAATGFSTSGTASTSNSVTVSSATNCRVVAAHLNDEATTAFSAYNQTSRYTASQAVSGSPSRLLIGDATGASSITSTATQASAQFYAAAGVSIS